MDRNERVNQLARRILENIENNTTQKSDAIWEFPASNYSDPEQYALELERIFKRVPLLLGLTIEIPAPKNFKTIEIANVPLLIARGEDGKVRLFLNACKHRGAPLTTLEYGKTSRFVCPYHGWTYQNDGRLTGVADRNKFGEFDLSSCHLMELPCEERVGLIFGMLTPGAAMDIDQYFGALLDDFAHYGIDRWHLYSKRELIGANWKIAFDGYLESYHFPAAHAQTLAPNYICNVSAYDAFGPNIRFLGALRSAAEDLSAVPDADRWTREGVDFGVSKLLFPNVSFFVSPKKGISQVVQILPGPTVGQSRTILYHICPQPPQSEQERMELDATRDFLVKVLHDEDYLMGLNIQRGVGSGLPLMLRFGRNEPANQYFHQWVQYYVNGDDNAPPPVLGNNQ